MQSVAIYNSETLGTLKFYSNGRINKPRHENGVADMHWSFEKGKLWVSHHKTTVSADGRTLTSIKAKLVSGRPLIPPR